MDRYEKEKWNKTIASMLYLLYAVWIVVFISVAIHTAIVKQYPYQKGIALQYARCEQAGDAEQLADCLTVLIGNMETAGMTEGHDQFYFRSPATEMRQDFQALENIRDRAQAVADNTALSSLEQQYGMTELRGQLDTFDDGFMPRAWALVNVWPRLGMYLAVWGLWPTLLAWIIPLVFASITKPWW